MIEACIFDLDGTLVDSMPMYVSVYQEVFQKFFGMGIDSHSLTRRFGHKPTSILLELFDEYGIKPTEEEIKELRGIIRKRVYEEIPTIGILPGVIELLDQIKDEYKLAIATSRAKSALEIIKSAGIGKYFSEVVIGSEVENAKPAPDIFLLTAKKLGMDPSETCVFEDSVYGVRAAKSAGMKIVAVASGGISKEELAKEDPDVVVESLKDFDLNVV